MPESHAVSHLLGDLHINRDLEEWALLQSFRHQEFMCVVP